MKLPNCPKVGDYLKFRSEYTFSSNGQLYEEMAVGTLAKVIERRMFIEDWQDEVECNLIISILNNGENRLYKFNWTIHQLLVDIIEDSTALKLLYNKKK